MGEDPSTTGLPAPPTPVPIHANDGPRRKPISPSPGHCYSAAIMREPLADLATADPDLRLVELTATDARDYHDLLRRSHVHLTEFGDYDREVDSTFEEILAHFEKPADRHHRYGIRLSDRLVGRIDLNPVDPPRYSIGYWLGVDALGRGYATLCGTGPDHSRGCAPGGHRDLRRCHPRQSPQCRRLGEAGFHAGRSTSTNTRGFGGGWTIGSRRRVPSRRHNGDDRGVEPTGLP